jgi:uncharacterized protein Yka (UPF0111/DUF47 family)
MGFISRFLLPRQVDFNTALLTQAQLCRAIVDTLSLACTADDVGQLEAISNSAKQGHELKDRNMQLLLDVFITPYDKESIYRMITELDWVTLSVKHFQLEAQAYRLRSLRDYAPITAVLADMAAALEAGIRSLPDKALLPVGQSAASIHDRYDEVVGLCATASARLIAQGDIKQIIRRRDLLLQLKEVAKRIHIAANTLEDMTIKVS